MGGPYLKYIKMDAFGAFGGKTVGPFAPGLNAVFGENEAGKTTVASFVDGVLFGWREARGIVNTYKPANAERSGSLFFSVPQPADPQGRAGGDGQAPADEREVELSRVRNAEGLQGDATIVADIDKETFETVFSLTSGELMGLHNTSDVTAKLLTAGSGTGASPAHALAAVDERLAGYTSRSERAEHSLVRLGAEKERLRAEVAEAAEEEQLRKREDEELLSMDRRRSELSERTRSLNGEIELLCATRVRVEKIDAELAQIDEELAALEDEGAELEGQRAPRRDEDLAGLVGLSASEERALRDQIDALAAEKAKRDHAVDLARDDYLSSKAASTALDEALEAEGLEAEERVERVTRSVLSVVLPILFAVLGASLFVFGSVKLGFSYVAFGIVLITLAALMAFAALVLFARPDRKGHDKQQRRANAQWVVLQDKKKLEACVEAQEEFDERARAELDAAGLAGAHGSIRQARELLDEARELRVADDLLEQRNKAVVSRRAKLRGHRRQGLDQRRRLLEAAGLREGCTLEGIDEALEQKERQREGLMEAYEGFNRRYGELKQELSAARGRRDFDALKQEYQQVCTREAESLRSFATLLLARRMLTASIAAWESNSQPEVYRCASRLLSLMTSGRWTKVELTEDGKLQVVDSVKNRRDPVLLSTGTRQQLYLALRIALLLEADNVGRAVPVLADDILVNFDASRRAGAAAALAELARARQVILFTSHKEVLEALRAADPSLNEIALSPA